MSIKEDERKESKNKKFQLNQINLSIIQVCLIVVTILSFFWGIVWYLYTKGSFGPNIELSQQASSIEYSYKKAYDDYRELYKENQKLYKLLSENEAELNRLRSTLKENEIESSERVNIKRIEFEKETTFAKIKSQEKQLQTNLRIAEIQTKNKVLLSERENMVSLITSCINATTPGAEAEIVSKIGPSVSGQYSSSSSNPAVAITAVPKSQNGVHIFEECYKKYKELFQNSKPQLP